MSVSIKKIFWMIVVNYLEKRQPFLIYMKESFGLVVEQGLWIMDNGRKVSSLGGGNCYSWQSIVLVPFYVIISNVIL